MESTQLHRACTICPFLAKCFGARFVHHGICDRRRESDSFRHQGSRLMALCIGCGCDIPLAGYRKVRSNKLRCTSDCGRSRGRKRKGGGHATREALLSSRAFIGVDGEGVTDPDGTHRYILITVGTESLHKDGATLDTLDIFRFLYDHFLAHPVAAFVGFYLGYDFSQILRGLPVDRARMLLTPAGIAKRKRIKGTHMPPFPVYYEGWDF